MKKEFDIEQLKTELFSLWLKAEELEEFGNDSLYEDGQVEGVREFLDFIENWWNKNMENDEK